MILNLRENLSLKIVFTNIRFSISEIVATVVYYCIGLKGSW